MIAPRPTPTPEQVHAELVRLAAPHVTHFTDDLYKHDLSQIADHPGTPFLHWCKGSGCGTWLIHLLPTEALPPAGEEVRYLFGYADREHIARQVPSLASHFAAPGEQPPRLTLYHDGRRFHVVTPARAAELARGYVDSLRREWREAATRRNWTPQGAAP